MSSPAGSKQPSQKAKVLAARLMAVQALFQAGHNNQTLSSVTAEYLEHRAGVDIEGEKMVMPDGALFQKIMDGVQARKDDLDQIVTHHFPQEKQDKEPLMTAILTCGTYEILAHDDIDAPILINDYLNVSNSFFSESETGLINAVLDRVAKGLRGS